MKIISWPVLAKAVEANFTNDQAWPRLTYQLDDGYRCTVDLLPTGRLPLPGQAVLLFLTTSGPVRWAAIPGGKNDA